jgi:tripartite-type tricarboxylate transporter receptor subunit TctC
LHFARQFLQWYWSCKSIDTIAQQGADAVSSTPSEFRSFVNAEIAKWAKAVKAAGIKPD